MGQSSIDLQPPAPPSEVAGEVIDAPDEKLQHADVALGFVREHEGVVYTLEQEKAVLRKIDMTLMPLVCSLSLMS